MIIRWVVEWRRAIRHILAIQAIIVVVPETVLDIESEYEDQNINLYLQERTGYSMALLQND